MQQQRLDPYYSTVASFNTEVEKANNADKLNRLVKHLRSYKQTRYYHVWEPGSLQYKACWTLLFNKAKELNLEFHKKAVEAFGPKQNVHQSNQP